MYQSDRNVHGQAMEESMERMRKSPLFGGMEPEEIRSCLSCCEARISSYERGQIIFDQEDRPSRLMVLLEGEVEVGSYSPTGKRMILATFARPGEIFGEVFVFLGEQAYDHYAQAISFVRLLEIPRDFLFHTCGEGCAYHSRMIANMLSILAGKAYYLNRKLQVVSAGSIRQRLARLLLQRMEDKGEAVLGMNREELADFLGTTRPSLSRELMNMQREGLILIRKRNIYIPDPELLQELL